MNKTELTAAIAELAAVRAHKTALANREKVLAALVTPELTADTPITLAGVTAKYNVSCKTERDLDPAKVLAYFKGEIPAALFTETVKTSTRLNTTYADKIMGLKEKTKAERAVLRLTANFAPAEVPAEDKATDTAEDGKKVTA